MMLQEENQGFETSAHKKTPSSSNYVLELDKAKIFWVVVLSLLVLTFVFVFGYWTGQYNVKEYTALAKEVASPQSLNLNQQDIAQILEEDKKNVQQSEQASSDPSATQRNILESSRDYLGEQKTQEEKSAQTAPQPLTRQKSSETATLTDKAVKKTSSVKPVAGAKKYAIQLASFKEEKKAMDLREKLLGKGFGGYVIRTGSLYRVRVGNFDDYNKAANTLSLVMKRFKISDAYIFNI